MCAVQKNRIVEDELDSFIVDKRTYPPNEKFTYCFWENKDHMWLYYNHWECKNVPKVGKHMK